MRAAARLAAALERLADLTGAAVAWLTLAMVLLTFAIVVLRYAFGLGWIAMQEAVTYLHAAVFMLGAAWTLRRDGHVRVDVLYRRMGSRARAAVDLAGAVLLLAPTCLYVLWSSWDYVATSWALREGSREAGGLPWVYWLKTLIPVTAVLLLLQGLAQAMRAALALAGAAPSAPAETAPAEPEV